MRTMATIGVMTALAWPAACAGHPDAGNAAPRQDVRSRAGEAADTTPRDRVAAPRAATGPERSASSSQMRGSRDPCDLLSAGDIADVTTITVERVKKTPNGCEWYANPAVERGKSVEGARGTLETLMKREPKTAEDGMRSMTSLLKSATGAIDPGKPLFAVTVQWENADQAEATLRTPVNAMGGGLPGGGLEPVPGLGDRAFIGAADALFYARKGDTLVMFGWTVATREQAIALAKRVISRI